jgi:hypothetical protein
MTSEHNQQIHQWLVYAAEDMLAAEYVLSPVSKSLSDFSISF